MSDFIKPDTIDQEIILNPTKVIMSKTDKEGVLEFANDYFVEVSGYEEYELMGKSIYCTQHPDMPEVIFKMMWEKLLKKQNCHFLIKNLAKNGKYYWAISDYAFKTDEQTGEILAIYNRRKNASREAVSFFSKFYKKLKSIEVESGIGLSEKFLIGHLEEIGKTFSELLLEYNKGFKVETPIPTISIVPPKQSEIIKEPKKQPVQEATIQQRIQEIQEKAKGVVKNTVIETPNLEITKTTAKKKGFFQKMFGKTDEELANELRQNK